MADVVILTVDGSGNVPPALGIGADLSRRGHAVRVLGHERQRDDVAAAGLDFVPYRHAFPWSGQARRSSARAAIDFLTLVGDRSVGRDLADACAARTADAVLVDAMIPGALVEARRLHVPAAALMHTFASFFLSPPMQIAGRVRGFSPREEWAAARTLVVSDRELDPAGAASAAARYTWTGVAEPPPQRVAHPALMGSGEPPLVLVSLSSVHIPAQEGMLRRIIAALADLPVRVLVTTGPTIDPVALPASANADVVRFVPHHDVMPLASLVVGHGGHSTAMRALMHGIPMLILPADPRIDQGMVGRAIARAGAGLCLPRSARPHAIASAVVELLSQPRYAAAAGGVGRRLRDADGIRAAADAVEGLATRVG